VDGFCEDWIFPADGAEGIRRG
jgi:hypothetical protein